MKKRFISKNMIQKTLISIIIVLLLSFAVPVRSQAGIGGILLDPLFDLVGTLCDVIVGGLQMFLVDGEFNNSSDGSLLNPFLVDPEVFEVNGSGEYVNENGKYEEFKYNNGEGTSQEVISEDELEKGLLGGSSYYIPVTKYTPAKIFSGLIPALDINFINPTDWRNSSSGQHYSINTDGDYVPDDDGILIEDPDNPGYYIRDPGYTNGTGNEMNERSVAIALHETIATWYVSLRNLSVVGLMLVLVYVGIRMVISSTASEKSKYKQMLMDWVIALCLLFCLHYIMTFTTTIVNEISKAVNGAVDGNTNNIAVTIQDSSGNAKYQFNTDLMGLIRLKMQSPTLWYKVLYLIFYIAMVIYTCLFTFTYLKRVLIMAFLTLIAPLVALTYPIDKMRDGKAQAFDMWLKEYTFNALLQPFHLVIYTIFVGSAIELSTKNPIFAIVALAFLTPAEKILRRFFGFDKSSTSNALGTFAGIAGGAAAFNMVSKALTHRGGKSLPKGRSDVKTKGKVEADVPSLGEALGGPSGQTNAEPGATNANATSIRQTSQPTDNTRIIYGPNGEVLSRVQPSESYASGGSATNLSSNETGSTAGAQTGVHGKGALQWTDDDTRGLGQYALDVGKGAAGWVGEKISNSAIGDIGRGVAGAASDWKKSISQQLGNNKFIRTVGIGAKKIRDFKPLANTAKGVANVAKKTGIAAGKGTLKLAGRVAAAAPGAVFGMAAGIAGDELGDIAKYTAAGAALTAATLPGAIGSMTSSVSSAGSFISDAYREGAYGDEAIIAQQAREFVKSKELDDLYKYEFRHEDGTSMSKAELKQRKEQGAYYAVRGVGGEDTVKAIKMEDKIKKELAASMPEEDAEVAAQQQTARLMKIAKAYSAADLRNENKVKGLTSSLEKELINGGFGKKEANEQAVRAVKYIKSSKGIKDA